MLLGIAEQDRRDLLARDASVRLKMRRIDAVDHAVLRRPADRLGVIGVRVHVGEGERALCLRLPGQTPEHRHQHPARHAAVRLKMLCVRAVEQPGLQGKIDAAVRPVGGLRRVEKVR